MTSFDESVLDGGEQLQRRDESRLLWSLASAGAQVRRAVELRDEFGLDRIRGDRPRAVLVATDTPPSAALRLVTRLSCESAPALAWHGVELPRWAGPADALLIGAIDSRHPRLVALAEQGAQRGLSMAVVAPRDSQVASAAGRAPVHALPDGTNPRAARWAVLTPLLLALDALELAAIPTGLLHAVADSLDETAELCRADSDPFTNPAKALAAEFSEAKPLIVGAGALASVAARAFADALQLAAGVGAVAVSLPDGVARAGALLRGAGPAGDDFFRDRVDDDESTHGPRLVIIGDDGQPDDPALGPRSGAQIQLDEVGARKAARALRQLAEELGVRASGVDVPAGPALARFAAAAAFGDFCAAYLAFGLGLDPGAPRPAELAH